MVSYKAVEIYLRYQGSRNGYCVLFSIIFRITECHVQIKVEATFYNEKFLHAGYK